MLFQIKADRGDEIISNPIMVFKMKRNKKIDSCILNSDQHKQCIAFHEAGHAAAIYLNNKARNLPPIFFQIIIRQINNTSDQSSQNASVARVEGGRLIQSLPYKVDGLAHKLIDHNEAMVPLEKDYVTAFEADIINLLVGPLAESKYVHERDNEPFGHQFANLQALENYGGDSDLALVREYVESFSARTQRQDGKLDELFAMACDFVGNASNWRAITRLANYILDTDKALISCEEVVSVIAS
jgi:hypothetical protein